MPNATVSRLTLRGRVIKPTPYQRGRLDYAKGVPANRPPFRPGSQDAVEWCYGHFDEREEPTQSVAERDAERFAAMFQSRDTQKGSGNVCH